MGGEVFALTTPQKKENEPGGKKRQGRERERGGKKIQHQTISIITKTLNKTELIPIGKKGQKRFLERDKNKKEKQQRYWIGLVE